MLRSKLIPLLFGIVLLSGSASIAVPVHIADDHRNLEPELQRITDTLRSFDEQKNAISDCLSKQGYLQPTITQSETALNIIPGVRFRLDSVYLHQDINAAQRIGSCFSSRLLDSIASSYTDSLHALGYLYAGFSIQTMRLRDSFVVIEADIIKGPSVQVVDTRLEGLKRTNPALVKRYLSLTTNSTVSESAIAAVEQEASQIPFITFVPPAQIQPRAGYEQADLALSFIEKRGVLLSGGVGYGGSTPDDLLWSLGATIDNLFGDGKEASFKSERREQKRELLDISYRQPLFLLHADDLHVHVATRNFSESFSEFQFGAQYSTRFKARLSGSLALSYRSVKPIAVSAYQTVGLDLGFTLSRVDNRLLPTKGYRLTNSIAGTWRQYQQAENGQTSFADFRLKSTVESYYPLKPMIFAATVRYDGLETSESLPPVAELFLIGGQGSLRGWNQDQFPVLRAVTFAFEPRLSFSGGYLFLFYDGGLLYSREASGDAISLLSRYRDGFGGGVSLRSGQKGLSLNLGWNRYTSFNNPLLGISLSTDL